MHKLEDNFVCPSCKGRLSQAAEVLSCPGCGKNCRKCRDVWDLRTVLSDSATGWSAEAFDLAYEEYDGGVGFKDRRTYAAGEGIPIVADEYLESEKELVIKNFISDKKPSALLDLGCGSGWFSFEMSECSPGTVIYGIDVSTYRTDLFRKQIMSRNRQDKMASAAANGENLPFPDAFFEVVVMDEVIEHLLEPGRTLKEAMRVLKPGGHLLITTPSRFMTRFWKTAAIVPTFIKRLFKGETLSRQNTARLREQLFSCHKIRRLVEDSGFETEKWKRVIFIPHESYLQFIPIFLLKIMIFIARIIGKIPFLGFLGLHHFIILKKIKQVRA
ncbi:MAG TPA: hypothetical protein DET40_11320 [Lentisphaeria bacterium]|nr:MAG: hypothetical protein A2X45_19870 [Lentisphaerae bacterium GWF2_50_93]HCE44129.1 hypothetical protein [Lentisphaeria bacterium]